MINIKQALENKLSDILVRPCTDDDFDQVYQCYASSFPDGHNRYPLARILRFQPQTCLLAELRDSNKIVGIILGFTETDKAWMTSLSILPDYRRRGYGSTLIIQIGLVFLGLGYKTAYATTEEPAIIHLSKRIGVSKKTWKENYFFDEVGRYVVEIDLEKNKLLLSNIKDN